MTRLQFRSSHAQNTRAHPVFNLKIRQTNNPSHSRRKIEMKFRRSRLVFGIILFILLVTASPLWRQHAQTPKKQIRISSDQIRRAETITQAASADAPSDGFLIVQTKDGEECRQMTVQEARELRIHERLVDLHAITDEKTSRTRQGFKITLRGTSQLEASPEAKQAFIRAAAKWEAAIQDQVTTVIDVDFGTTRFGVPFGSANIIGGTSETILFIRNQYDAIRQLFVQSASGPLQTAAYGALPTGSLPTDLGKTANIRFTTTELRLLGAPDPGINAAIGFNSGITFDFDPSDGIDAGKIDFEATAVHEIGHALGFISNTGFKEVIPGFPNIPSMWDYYRFRPGGLVLGSITNQARVQLTGGGLQSFFGVFDEFELSTGGPDGTGGDQRQSSHWRDDVLTGRYVGIMDPTGASGQPDFITYADHQGLCQTG